MGFFDDYNSAMNTYPEDYVTLEIININVSGDALNAFETGSFDVRVLNAGPLRMSNLTVKIKGLNGALVKDAGAIAPYVTEFVSNPGQFPLIAAHNGNDPQVNLGGFGFKAPGAQQIRDLVEVCLEEWDGDDAHLLLAHSDPSDAVCATYRERVLPI